jgi:hypothetical protein
MEDVDNDLAERIRLRASETGADIVILPERIHEGTGKGVYAQDTLLLVKRLKSEGVRAEYLDTSSDRYFVTQKSAVLTVLGAIGIGLVTNAAWDGAKKIVSLLRGTNTDPLTINVTDATETKAAEVSVTGSPAQVIDALNQLKARGLLPAETGAPVPVESSLTDEAGSSEPSNVPGPPTEHSRKQIETALEAGQEALERSRQLLTADPVEAERLARGALPRFRSALDWAEDSDREDETHRAMDAAGRWTCETFGCELLYDDGTYYRTCPVDLGHNRIGLSVGGVATRICSLCDRDFSVCDHDPAKEYLTPGGNSPLGYCRICMEQACTEHRPNLQYPARPGSIVVEMQLDEVSLVSRPAQPDARINRQEVTRRELWAALGSDFVPGMTVVCERCLRDCGGLIQMTGTEQG